MLLTISVTVIAASIVVVAIVLIPVILQIRRTAREAEKLLETVHAQLVVPLGRDLTVISKEVNGILQSVHHQVDRLEEGIGTVQDAAERLRDFEEVLLTTVEEPLFALTAPVRAVSRGIGAFLRFLRS